MRLQRGKSIEGVVEREQLIVGHRDGDFECVRVQVLGAGAAALPAFAPGAGDEDATHGLGGRAEEVRAVLMPFMFRLFLYALLNSTFVTLRQGGIRWRDTFYPLATLRAGNVR